jgi:hypothetical protein
VTGVERIKSSLEIAMERVASVKTDRTEIGQFEAKQKGKRLANEFLNSHADSFQHVLEDALKGTPKESQASVKQGIFDTLVAQIALPLTKEEEKRIVAIGKGLQTIIKDARFAPFYQQFVEIISRYLDEVAQCEQGCRRQYAPTLQQKEQELSRRYGQPVKLDPFQDPDFIVFYQQAMNTVKENYLAITEQVREQALLFFSV